MLRSVDRRWHWRARLGPVPLVLALSACAPDPVFVPIDVQHPAAERVVDGEGIEVELSATRYLERGVTLTIVVRNRQSTPVQIGAEGLLLGVGEFEYPLDPAVNRELPAAVRGETEARMQLDFATGAPIDEGAMLHLRAVRRQDRWLRIPPLPVDPTPISGPPASQG